MSTAGALIDMAAECGRAAMCDGKQDLDMGPAVAFDAIRMRAKAKASARSTQRY
jgi:hypothetical protein